jgi:hypothetical protein
VHEPFIIYTFFKNTERLTENGNKCVSDTVESISFKKTGS